MNIETVVTSAYRHFMDNYAGSIDSELVFTHYAADELGMNELDATAFAAKATNPKTDTDYADATEYHRFFTWYHLNYVLVPEENKQTDDGPKSLLNWRIDLKQFTGGSILEDISVQPRCSVMRGNKLEYETCFPDNAEIWSVFVHRVSGEMLCIADCKNKFTASYLSTMLKTIIADWNIKLLIDIKDAAIQQIFSNHLVQVATVDRDVLESGDKKTKNNLVREENITPNAKSKEFYSAIPIYDEQDQLVKNQLQKVAF